MRKKFWVVGVVLAFVVLGLANVVFADVMVPDMYPEKARDGFVETFLPLVISFSLDIIVLALVLNKVGILKDISGNKFLFYMTVVFVTGLVCDFLAVAMIREIGYVIPDHIKSNHLYGNPMYQKYVLGKEMFQYKLPYFALYSGLLLFVNNFLLAKRFTKLDNIKCMIIGAAFAIFTNPAIGMLIGFGRNYLVNGG